MCTHASSVHACVRASILQRVEQYLPITIANIRFCINNKISIGMRFSIGITIKVSVTVSIRISARVSV